MRDIALEKKAFEQYSDWALEDKNIFLKIRKLIDECSKSPFEGTGKPEPLKHHLKGTWSRRITDEHRLI